MITADKGRWEKMGCGVGWGGEVGGKLTFCLANPGSITNTTPSMVRDVSAMFVDTTTCGNENTRVKTWSTWGGWGWRNTLVCMVNSYLATCKYLKQTTQRLGHSFIMFHRQKLACRTKTGKKKVILSHEEKRQTSADVTLCCNLKHIPWCERVDWRSLCGALYTHCLM